MTTDEKKKVILESWGKVDTILMKQYTLLEKQDNDRY